MTGEAYIPVILVTADLKRKYPADALVVSTRLPFVKRNNQKLRMDPTARRCLIALCANAGCWLTKDELIEVCFGDCPEGGPENAGNRISIAINDCRAAGAALGLVVSSTYGKAMARPWTPSYSVEEAA